MLTRFVGLTIVFLAVVAATGAALWGGAATAQTPAASGTTVTQLHQRYVNVGEGWQLEVDLTRVDMPDGSGEGFGYVAFGAPGALACRVGQVGWLDAPGTQTHLVVDRSGHGVTLLLDAVPLNELVADCGPLPVPDAVTAEAVVDAGPLQEHSVDVGLASLSRHRTYEGRVRDFEWVLFGSAFPPLGGVYGPGLLEVPDSVLSFSEDMAGPFLGPVSVEVVGVVAEVGTSVLDLRVTAANGCLAAVEYGLEVPDGVTRVVFLELVGKAPPCGPPSGPFELAIDIPTPAPGAYLVVVDWPGGPLEVPFEVLSNGS